MDAAPESGGDGHDLNESGEGELRLEFVPNGPVRALPLTPSRRQQVEEARSARHFRLLARDARIDELLQDARAKGHLEDRSYWMLVYDFEMAPTTNGRTMLLEHGIIPVPPQDLSGEDQIHEALWTVIEALGASGVYLLNTDHLTDTQLYERLFYKILDEPTQCLPPASGSCEYIDVLHQMDIDAGGLGCQLNQRLLDGVHPSGPCVKGERAPPQKKPIGDRDRFLPRPDGK
jgi:hypothetical protein